MVTKNNRPQPGTALRLFIGACFALALVLLIVPLHASAHTTLSPHAGPTFQVNAGFDSRYQDNHWVPIHITLHNDGPDFNGKISINVPAPYSGSANTASTSTYQAVVSLPTGAQKQLTLYAPIFAGSPGTSQNINVDLLDANNQKVFSQQSTLRSISTGDIFIGVLSDQSTFGALGSPTSLPTQSSTPVIQQLNASSMPDVVEALNNFDLIVLDNFNTDSLSPEQLSALQNWVGQGGTLIAVGGPEWRRTLSHLSPALLPVTITGTDTLAPGTHLLPIGGPTKSGPDQQNNSDTLQAPVMISAATATPGSTVLHTFKNTPLIAQAYYERGNVYYLAFDPMLEPIAGWPNANNLWKGLLIRSLGEKLLSTNQNVNGPFFGPKFPGQQSGFEGLLQSLFPSAFPATWLILVLLLGYIAVLGPLRLLLVRVSKKRDWSWRVVLATIVVFSLLSYGLAIQQKGTSIISSSISVIQLNRPDASASTAHVTTYLGVFVPSQGDFQVHIADNNLVQSSSGQSNFYGGPGPSPASERTTITSTQHGTDVDLQGVDIWTLRSLVAKHDSQVKGGIASNLTIQDNTLAGTVTNTLPYPLSDVYVLIGSQYLSLGHMQAGETKQVNLSLNSSSSSSSSNQQSLSDQIASSQGLQTPYGPYYNYNGQQPQNDFQRHMAMLSTLSGDYNSGYCGGGPCYRNQPIVIQNGNGKQVFYNGGGNASLFGGRDPLLIAGAPATLIAWTDHLPDIASQVTINGTNSTGVQEALVEAPLDVNFSGSVNLSSSFVTGQLIDVQNQGNNIQMLTSNVYTMTTGSMTFEFNLPNIPRLQASTLTINETNNFNNGFSPGGNQVSVTDVNHLHVYLYNWQTGSWDAFTMNQFSLSVDNAAPYADAHGRVLLQFANQDSTQGTALLTRPSLQLQGTVSH